MAQDAPPAILDYAPRPEFDTGLFAARYFQVLACISIALMIAWPLLVGGLRIDITCPFLLWAAVGLKRHNPTARYWVLSLAILVLFVFIPLVLAASFLVDASSAFLIIRLAGHRIRIPDPAEAVAFALIYGLLIAVPLVLLLTPRAARQFTHPQPPGSSP